MDAELVVKFALRVVLPGDIHHEATNGSADKCKGSQD
jgi:hypothetical protein